jgi:tetratricopeptide (TPR) repeat protein
MTNGKVHRITAWSFFLIIVVGYTVLALKFPVAYIIGTYEDFIGEWSQFFFFIAAMLISARLATVKSGFRIFFAIISLACFFAAGEEISWGQRLLDISSTEFLQKYNQQQETNIHNLFSGPYATASKRAVQYAQFTGFVLYGLVYPLALRLRWQAARWIEGKGVAAPPLYLWPFFVLGAALETEIFKFNEKQIAEILVSSGLSIFFMHYWVSHINNVELHSNNSLSAAVSRQLALRICAVFLCVVLSGSAVTLVSYYGSTRLQTGMDSRFWNGIEKFAGRYKKYKQWDTAAQLYLLVDTRDPGRPSILRNLSKCYHKEGDDEKSRVYLNKALDTDMERLKSNPKKVSANLSLVYTYRLVGDKEKAKYHMDTALQSALEKVRNEPNSASAAYWLGQAYLVSGNNSLAYQNFQKAFQLKPSYTNYKKALLNVQSLLNNQVTAEEGEDPEN